MKTMMDEKTFKEMLVNITAEALTEAQQTVAFLDDHLKQADGPALPDNARGIMIATMLIEYGKLKGRETHGRTEGKENLPAVDDSKGMQEPCRNASHQPAVHG